MASIPILLTFDDGPAPARTNRIIQALKTANSGAAVKAAFFVQTRACTTKRRPKTDFTNCSAYSLVLPLQRLRMSTNGGKASVVAAQQDGHVIAIHSGSLLDHYPHCCRVMEPADSIVPLAPPVPANGLESDLRLAMHDIELATRPTEYVRATGLAFGNDTQKARMNETYQRLHLRHIGVNVDSRDADITGNVDAENKKRPPGKKLTLAQKRQEVAARILKQLDANVKQALQHPYDHLIVLFHDINPTTVERLVDFVTAIKSAVVSLGHTAAFPTNRNEAESILQSAKAVYE